MSSLNHWLQKSTNCRNVYQPIEPKGEGFFDDLQKLAKDSFRKVAHAINEQLKCVKVPPHVQKMINQGHKEKGTHEQIVTHLERENWGRMIWKPLQELKLNTVSQFSTEPNSLRSPNQHAFTVKYQNTTEINAFN